MICKECGAYNPDHATYCKVCAASLKEEVPDSTASDAVDESRPTRSFVRPSWTVPAYSKAASAPRPEHPKKVFEPEKDEDDAIEEEPILFPEEPESMNDAVVEEEAEPEVEDAPVFTPHKAKKHAPVIVEPEEEEEEIDDDSEELKASEPEEVPEEEEEEYVPVYHRNRRAVKHAPIHLDEEEDDEEEEDRPSDEDSEDDSYEYEPTPPKRKNKNGGNGPLFWILLAAIIVVILCIIVAGVLMFLQSGGKKLSCAGAEQTSKTQNAEVQNPADVQQSAGDSAPVESPSASPYDVEMEEGYNDEGKECVIYSIVVPAHGVVTIVLPSQGEQTYPSSNDTPVIYSLTVPKYAYYPNVPLTDPVYEVHPEIYLTEADGSTRTLSVPSFTLTFPTLSIDLEKPVLDENGHIMANKENLVPISGHVNDYDVRLYVNDEQVTVYSEGLFMPDYAMNATEPVTVTLRAEKENWVTATTEFIVDPYVYTPDKMILNVANDRVTELKADKTGKITVRGTTLPNATLTATSDVPSKVVCGSVSVDGEGNFTFGVTMDSSFYGIANITINAEKEDAESGSITFKVYRMYADRSAFIQGYNKTKSYKEIGSSKKYVTISALMANATTYASSDYGFRVTAKVVEVTKTEDGYSVVRMTLAGSGETIYVINLSEKWAPDNNIGGNYNLYGSFLGTYTDGASPYFAAYFAVNK